MKKSSSLYRLDPFIDGEGLLRVGGRIRNADLPDDVKHPYILPRKSHVTELIVRHYHQQVKHQGRGINHGAIRSSGIWIIGGASVVAHHISKCVTCRKLRSAPCEQKMANLPTDCLEPSPPFTYTATDYFGPWLVKEGRREIKGWGVLYTCMVSRAIHLETACSMDTSSFINSYRRFVGRRGPCRQLRSDRGTNYVGAKNELQAALEEMDDERIRQTLMKDG